MIYAYRPKYLMIVEKPYIARKFKEVYERMGDDAHFDVDIIPANCHVVNVNDDVTCVNVKLEPFALKNREVEACFRIIRGGDLFDKIGQKIDELVGKNSYDAIINACDPDEEGELKFQYTIESLGL